MGVRIEGYSELHPLASGRASDTYRTRLPASARWVAVKVFRFQLRPEPERRRYLRAVEQARTVAGHSGIATIYDAGFTADDRPYLAMQQVPGGSVADRLALASHGPYTPADVARIGREACEALAVAHGAGLLHRFLQPTSLLLGPGGDVVLTELGLPLHAERWEAAGYADDAVPWHAAPEVLERSAAGEPADVWALASTLWTMAVGHPPHQVDGVGSAATLLLRTLREEPPRLVDHGLPESLDSVLRAALTADPGQRTPRAELLGRGLDEVAGDLAREVTAGVPESPPAELPPLFATPGSPGEPGDTPEDAVSESGASEFVASVSGESAGDTPENDAAIGSEQPGTSLAVVGSAVEVADRPTSGRNRWVPRAAAALAVGAAIAVGILIGDVQSDGPGSDNGTETVAEEGSAAADEPVPATDGTREAPVVTGPVAVEPEVPTGFRARESDAGVVLTWDEADIGEFYLLVLSETGPPEVSSVSGNSYLFGSDELADGDGYCFAVARVDMLGRAAGPEDPTRDGGGQDEVGGPDDIGPAFSPLSCIRGASSTTVRLDLSL